MFSRYGNKKVCCPVKQQIAAAAIAASRLLSGVNGYVEYFLAETIILLLNEEINELLIILHRKRHIAVFRDNIVIIPLGNISVHIADRLFRSRIK